MRLWMIIVGVAAGILAGLVGISMFFSYRASAPLTSPPSHGTEFVIEYDASHSDANALAKLQQAIQKRLIHFGTRMFWEPLGSNQVRISTPIDSPELAEAAKSFISLGGKLEFRLVHEDNAKLLTDGTVPAGYEILKEADKPKPPPQKPTAGLNGGVIYTGTIGKPTPEGAYIVKIQPEMAGNYIKQAYASRDQLGRPEIMFELNAEGADKFGKVTADNLGRKLAIVLDDKLQSAPVINSAITGGNAVITGSFTEAEAQVLATTLDSPLPMPIKIIETKTF